MLVDLKRIFTRNPVPGLRQLILKIRTNFWFIPMLLSVAAVLLALFINELDNSLDEWGLDYEALKFKLPIETAREVLSTIAGAMITVASLVFSMTLVALILVSQQLGPRVLIRFMDDRPTQIILGLFTATFIFSILVLIQIDNGTNNAMTPGLAVMMSIILALASIAMLIHFIHHISTRIQADVIISELGENLQSETDTYLEALADKAVSISLEHHDKLMERFASEPHEIIPISQNGYFAELDINEVETISEKHNLSISVLVKPGDFIIHGAPFFKIILNDNNKNKDKNSLNNETGEALANTVKVNEKRTPEASIRFEIEALREVALRALSPGINDPQTAISCINKLTESLAALIQAGNRQQAHQLSKNGWLIYPRQLFDDHLDVAFASILESGRNNRLVLDHIKAVLNQLKCSASNHQTDALKKLISIVEQHLARLAAETKGK